MVSSSFFEEELGRDQWFMCDLRSAAASKGHNPSQHTDQALLRLMGVREYLDQALSRRAHLQFDGETLYWFEIGHNRRWRAKSGRKGYWSKVYQYLADKGPIPEGFYEVRQDHYSAWDDLPVYNKAMCILGPLHAIGLKRVGGAFPGCTDAWGRERISLVPKPWTKTKGRGGFFIHGGTHDGSAGCINLNDSLSSFMREFHIFGRDVLLEVKYKNTPDGTGFHGTSLDH